MNLYSLFESRMPADPSAPLMVAADGGTKSYADAIAASARMANLLISRGISPGERVAVQVEKSPEAIFLYLACLRSGAIYLPLNTAYRPDEMAYFLGDAEPALVVCRPEDEAAVADLAAKAGCRTVLTLGADGRGSLTEQAASQPAVQAVIPREDGDLAAILYSSGTTGRPKGAMISHGNLASNAQVLHRYWGFRPGDVLLHALPIFHTHGLFVATHCVLLNGGSMIFLPRFDADEVISLLPRATVMMGVPTFYTRLLAHPGLTRDACRHMRLFISGSAPLLTDTFLAFAERTGQRILERYGMTETNMLTSNPLDGARREGTVGMPLPGVSLRIADEEDNPLPQGAVGQIEVKGPNVFGGYWRMPEKTAAEFTRDGYFRTGDLGRIDADGYVSIVGRAKDLIISGGYNVYPKEIEEVIDAMPGVVESAVVGMPHPDFGEAGLAVIKRQAGAAIGEAEILAELKERLANYKIPKRVVFIDDLPRNTMGKVQKNVLRQSYAAFWQDTLGGTAAGA